MRKRLGMDIVPKGETFKAFIKFKDRADTIGFISDQTPANVEKAYWTTFLNQDTAFFKGMEKIARKFNYAVAYAHVTKVKRGHYEIRYDVLFDDLKNVSSEEILEGYIRKLEAQIVETPELWLWSHKRWKKKKPF